ncbi:MAG: hypothetical protein ACRDPH_10065, partial [Marmoricola sp.]
IGMCEWWAETSNGTDFSSTTDIAIAIDANKTCGGAPGGFGWLDPIDGGCQPKISVGDSADSNPGNGKGHSCEQEISDLVGSVVYLPIYDSTTGGGNNGTYHIRGLAAFYLDGVESPSFSYTGTAPNNIGSPKCSGNACLWGYFTKALIPVGPVDSDCGAAAPSCDLGLETIQPIG